MKILLVGIGYRGYAATYETALARLGHEVTTYVGLRQYHLPTRLRRVAQVTIPRLFGVERDYLWSEQIRFARAFRRQPQSFDLVLFVNADRLATDETLGLIARTGASSGVWLLDDVGTLPTSDLDLGSFNHLASFNRQDAEAEGGRLGRIVHFVPQGFAPIAFSPQSPTSPHPLVLGAAYPSRLEAVRSMLAAGLGVDVVGRTWPDTGLDSPELRLIRDVSLSESLSMSAGARTCVNGHRNASTGVSPRVFEIGGAGGLIVSDNPRAAEFYEPGVEMLAWREPEEAAEHAVRASRDGLFAARIAAAGHRRTLHEHTIGHRFDTLLRAWGLSRE